MKSGIYTESWILPIILAQKLGYINGNQQDALLIQCTDIARLLNALSKSLHHSPDN